MPFSDPAREPLGASLARLIAELEACGKPLDGARAAALLRGSALEARDLAPYVVESAHGYTRRRVLRTEAFELLVMTWRPGQASTPHDHAGSSCALKVLSGAATETRFRLASDGLVDPVDSSRVLAGAVTLDTGSIIHRLSNELEPGQQLVTLHVYCPPLPELRRYAARPSGARQSPVFLRSASVDTPRVVIVGAGFSGTMVAAQLLRRAESRRLHVVLFERHSAFGEGAAYRTADARHLLNVPAAKMSAWPDRPNDFLDWVRARQPDVSPYDFLPRCLFGEYLRATFGAAAAAAGEGTSAEIRRDDVCEIRPRASGWRVWTRSGASFDAAAVVLATGHRPPDDAFGTRWHGSRARLVADPWASLTLSAILPDEPVIVLGTGLTALDALLTLGVGRRSAAITAVSRRGLLPAVHADAAVAPADPSSWLVPLLSAPGGPTARALLRALRAALAVGHAQGVDWRAVIDGLRPHTPAIWAALSRSEAVRWMRHVRPFWEVHRHRMAPRIAQTLAPALQDGSFRAIAGRVVSAEADGTGVTLTVRRRGADVTESLRAAWVINCTGPGVDARTRTDPALASLIEAEELEPDPLGLGVLTGPSGEALVRGGRTRPDLLVVGTLRKPQLWESTAIPELRGQAAQAAAHLLRHCEGLRESTGPTAKPRSTAELGSAPARSGGRAGVHSEPPQCTPEPAQLLPAR